MRFRALIVAVVLAAGAALGGWVTTSNIAVGTPYDVQLLGDAGSFVVTGTTSAQYVSCDQLGVCAPITALPSVGLAGASINTAGCMWGVVKGSTGVVGNGACNYGGNLVSGVASRLRCLPSGFCAATVVQGATTPLLEMTGVPAAAPWTPQSLAAGGPTLPALSVLQLGNVTYTLASATARSLYLSVDGGASPQVPVPLLTTSLDAELFVRRDGTLGVLYTRPGAPFEFFGTHLTVVGAAIDAGWVSPTVPAAIEGLGYVAYTEAGGSDAGFGFGMASQRDGGALMASPIPNPGRPGLDWVQRTTGSPGAGVLGISCLDPTFCVAITSASAFVYWNAAHPAGNIFIPSAQEGATVQALALATDPDGDPVFVTWDVDGGGLYSVVADAGDPAGATAYVTFGPQPGASCTSNVNVTARATDGYAPHEWTITGSASFSRTTPDVPTILGVTPAIPGGVGVSLVADAGACSGTLTWAMSSGPGVISQGPGAAMALYTPPSSWCTPDAGAVVRVTSTIAGGGSMSGSATIPIVSVPDVPSILGAQPVAAGGPPLTLVADGGSCPGAFSWMIFSGPGGVAPMTNSATTNFTPPASWCFADAGTVVQLTSVIGTSVTSSQATIPILPNPDVPSILGVQPVQAGGAPLILVADGGACSGVLQWTLLGDAGVLRPTTNGDTATFTPPSDVCQADGGVQVQLTSTLGSAVAFTTATIPLAPWGVPNPPIFVPSNTVMQPAGTDASYPLASMGNHACQGSMGFPGVTIVSVDGGGLLVSFTPTSTGLDVSSADPCALGTYDVEVQTAVAGQVSPYAGFSVTLTDNAPPLTSATVMFGINVQTTSPLSGNFTGTISCPARHDLQAKVDVFRVDDGGFSGTTGARPFPGPWTLNVAGGCGGGSFVAHGTLVEDGGTVDTDDSQFTTQQDTATVSNLGPSSLEVTCDGLSQDVHVDGTGCPLESAYVTWTQTGGVPVALTKVTNSVEHLSSTNPGLDGLVGETLTLNVLADNGAGQTSTTSGTIQLVHSFVAVTHELSPAAANADSLATVKITVRNMDPCGAQNIVLHETPNGLQPLTDSVRVGRDPTVATLAGTELDIGPFALAANESRVITYLSRVPLLGTPKPTATAWIKSTDVTVQLPGPPPQSACGCDSAPSALLLLLAAVSLSSRRRAPSPARTSRRIS